MVSFVGSQVYTWKLTGISWYLKNNMPGPTSGYLILHHLSLHALGKMYRINILVSYRRKLWISTNSTRQYVNVQHSINNPNIRLTKMLINSDWTFKSKLVSIFSVACLKNVPTMHSHFHWVARGVCICWDFGVGHEVKLADTFRRRIIILYC